jgi:prophage antirepressor-like protein
MLNLFKSPKKQEVLKQDERSLIVKQFKGLNIQVYGTYEEPLFKAKDIGDLLGIEKIRKTIDNLDELCKIKLNAPTGGVGSNNADTWFLTEEGLYEVLFISRKPIAKQFRAWVRNIIKEIRLRGKYDLEEKLKEHQQLLHDKELEYKRTQQELLKYKEKTYEEIEKTGHIYVIKTDGGTKVGKTKDTVTKRIKGLQTGNVNDIEVILDFSTSNADLLEKCVHYILDRYRCNSNREFFDCNVNYIKTVVEVCGTVIDTLKSSYQHISKEELVGKLKCKGIEVECRIDETMVLESSEVCDFYNWLEENIVQNDTAVVNLKDICFSYFQKEINKMEKSRLKKEVEKWLSKKISDIDHVCRDSRYNGDKYNGWRGITIKQDD